MESRAASSLGIFNQRKLTLRMPDFADLPIFWKNYFTGADLAISENFWGNLSVLKRDYKNRDAYALQLEEIGYCFKKGSEHCAPFYQTVSWSLTKLSDIVNSGQLPESDIIIPAKAFEVNENGLKKVIFIPFGMPVPAGAIELNLLPPDIFVQMLSLGFFPMGAPIREHTNQTLCEHDMAHIAGFISNPRYMKAIRMAFQRVQVMMEENPAIKKALSNFDSLYSLRLYYMIEVFSIVSEINRERLEDVLRLKIEDFSLDKPQEIYPRIVDFLLAANPAVLNKYLYHLYEAFPSIVNPLGGESRDILNRTRKFGRGNQAGSFYSTMSNLDSKFDGSSIYSLFLNAKAALENKRSNHPDYEKTIREIHAPLIGSLLGTSQLTVEDWVFEAIKEVPDKDSKLYKYIVGTGLWNKSHVLYWAYGHPDCTKVLTNADFSKDNLYFADVEQSVLRLGSVN